MGLLDSITGDGLLGFGGNLLGGVVSGIFGNSQQKKQNSYNEYMWNEQNKYNSPKEQMKRLKEAGLNPYLYANSLSGNQAGSPVPSAQGYTGDLGVADATNHIVNNRQRREELELKKQVLNKTKLDNGILGQQKEQIRLQNELLKAQINKITSGIDYLKVEQNNKWNERILNQKLAQQRYDTRPTGESYSFGSLSYNPETSSFSISPGYSHMSRR